MWKIYVFLSNYVVQEKERQIQCDVNDALPIVKQPLVNIGSGWLHSF